MGSSFLYDGSSERDGMKKYEIIQNELRAQITSGIVKPGDKLPSESELCRAYAVSRNVVRQALRNLEAEGLSETLKGIGSFARTPLVQQGRTGTIGFISFFTRDYIFPQIISAADTRLYPEGYHLVLGQSLYDLKREADLLDRFTSMHVDGIIMEPVYDGTREHSNAQRIERVIESGIPVVFIDSTIPAIAASSITLNDWQAGVDAARHLLEYGHTDIALFYQEDYLAKVHRKEGAESYLRDHGLSPQLFPFTGQGEASSAPQVAQDLMERYDGSYSAVFCSSDADAMYLIEAADSCKVNIPEQLSIIGFDNQTFSAHNRISLTTFPHPSAKVGRLAASSILEAINHPSDTSRTSTVLDLPIVRRDSVKNLLFR